MFAKLTLSALTLAIAAPAFAMGSGTQLERSIGVEAGAYSLAEQALLNQAIDDNDYRLINFITGKNVAASRSADAGVFATEVTSGPAFVAQRASEQ